MFQGALSEAQSVAHFVAQDIVLEFADCNAAGSSTTLRAAMEHFSSASLWLAEEKELGLLSATHQLALLGAAQGSVADTMPAMKDLVTVLGQALLGQDKF